MNKDDANDVLSDLQKEYDVLCEREKKIDSELNVLLGNQQKLDAKIISFNNIIPNIQIVYKDAKNLSKMIDFTGILADNVSSKVRQLDVQKSRVLACITRVTDILDLKACTDGVKEALADEDYETAAGHIHRYLSLDKASLIPKLQDTTDNSEKTSLDQAFQLLQEAEYKLKQIVDEKYDLAVKAGDLPQAERFFKIFPLIGQHDVGLEKFSRYLCNEVAQASERFLSTALSTEKTDRRWNILFADTLILLFEKIAETIEAHQPLVETYYGHGRMFGFVKNIQNECDRQVQRILVEFKKKRKFDYLFRIVQQSISMAQSSMTNEKLDPRDLDILLAEITLINARCELYLSFLKKRIFTDIEAASLLSQERASVEQFFSNCTLNRSIQEIIGQYTLFEDYFMIENVNKAISMDTITSDSLTSSIVDDVFFIIKKCVRRSLSSGSVDGCCAMLNHAVSILESKYKDALSAKLKQGYPSGFDLTQAYNVLQTTIQQGRLQSNVENVEKQKLQFLITLNNIESTINYIYTLKKIFEDEINKLFGQVSKQSSDKLQSCLNDLYLVAPRFKSLLDYGFNQLNASALKPKIKQSFETFTSLNHKINEEELLNYEANDPFIQNFIKNIDLLLAQFKDSLSTQNFQTLVGVVTLEIVNAYEKATFKCTFNKYGGIQLDKEIRCLVNYLTSITTWSMREKFSRLNQLTTLLSLDKPSEIYDYWDTSSGSNITWRLTPNEVRQCLSLRLDFRQDDIKKLKF